MKATRRDVEAAQRRTSEAEAATTTARKELADWRAKAYALQTKVGACWWHSRRLVLATV